MKGRVAIEYNTISTGDHLRLMHSEHLLLQHDHGLFDKTPTHLLKDPLGQLCQVV